MKQQTVYTRLDDNLLNIIKDVYVFTPEELLALKKQVASDAFDAGRTYQRDFGILNYKEEYLKNLTNAD